MTQQHAVRRETDDELLGFVALVDHAWVPAAVFGAPLAGACAGRDAAEEIVRTTGLSSLAEAWDNVDDDGSVHTAHIVEASTTHVTLVLGHYFPDPATRFTLTSPVGAQLRRR
jgi:hypothetical protein